MIIGLVAVEKGHGIGFQGQMPWPRLKEDLEWFKDRTTDHIVLMGSTTWKSIGKILDNRINIVISSQFYPDANLTFSDPFNAIEELKERFKNKDICIIGGQQIYDTLKEVVECWYITEIDAAYVCDKFFNLEFVKENYREVTEISQVESTEHTPSYTIKEYKK